MTERETNQIMRELGEIKGLLVGIQRDHDTTSGRVGTLEKKVEILMIDANKLALLWALSTGVITFTLSVAAPFILQVLF